MSGGEVAGKLVIPVESDTSLFAKVLKAKVEEIASHIEAKIKAVVDGDSLREQVEASVKKATTGITAKVGVEIDQASAATFRARLVTVVDAAAKGVTANVQVDVDKRKGGLRAFLSGNQSVKVNGTVDTNTVVGTWRSKGRAKVQREIDKHPLSLPLTPASWRSAFKPVLYASLASLIQPLVATVVGSLGGLAAMLANLSAGVQVLAGAPVVLGAFIAGLGVSRMAVKALSGELSKINPALRPVRREFDKIGKSWEATRTKVALAFWRDLGKDINQVGKVFMPNLTKSMVDHAKAMNVVNREGLRLAGSPLFNQQFMTVSQSSTRILGAAGAALLGWVRGLLNMSVAAGPILDRFAGFIERTGSWASQIAAPGEKAKAFGRELGYAADKASQLWDMLKNTGAAIKNTFKVARGSGDSLLASLEANIKKWRDWTESIAGRNTIQQWFKDVEPIARKAGDLIVGIGQSLARMSADPNVGRLLERLQKDLLPVLERFLNNLGKSLGNEVIDLLINLLSILTEMSEAGAPIARGISIINGALSGVGKFLAENPRIAATLGTLLGALLAYRALAFIGKATGLLSLFEMLNMNFGRGQMVKILGGAGLAVAGFSGQLSGLPGPANGAAVALGSFVALRTMMPEMTGALAAFRARAGGVGASFSSLFSSLSGGGGARGGGVRGFMSAVGSTAKSGLRGAVGALGTLIGGLTGGPIGLGVAAVSTALGFYAQAHADAAQKVQDHKARVDGILESLEKESGAITDATRAGIAKDLIDSGAAQKAKDLGINLADLTDSVLGNVSAQGRLRLALIESNRAAVESDFADAPFVANMKSYGVTVDEFADAVFNGGTELAVLRDKLIKAGGATNGWRDTVDYAIRRAEAATEAQRGLGTEVNATGSAVTEARRKFELMNGLLDVSKRQVKDVATELSKVPPGKSITVKTLTAEAEARLRDLGFKVQRMPDGQFKVTASTAAAKAAIAEITRPKTAYVYVKMVSGGNQQMQADGGILQFADGGLHGVGRALKGRVTAFRNGTEQHIAQIARAGDWRVWAEDETGGEAYIPLGASKRARSTAILGRVADMFGYMMMPKVKTLANALTSPVVSSGAPLRTAGVAAGVAAGGGESSRVVFEAGAIQVNNPLPEPASASIASTVRKIGEFGLFGGDG